jgi:hypothetical protein
VVVNVPVVVDDVVLSLSLDGVVLGYASKIPFSLRSSVEIL